MFFSTKSLRAGVSQRETLAPRTERYNPTNPTPEPSSNMDFPSKLIYPSSLKLCNAFASMTAYL